jgi:hypothetical protein
MLSRKEARCIGRQGVRDRRPINESSSILLSIRTLGPHSIAHEGYNGTYVGSDYKLGRLKTISSTIK